MRKRFMFWNFQANPDDIDIGVGGGPINTPETPKSPWPDDWVQQYAGEDESKTKILSRYASVPAALDGLLAAQQKIRSGEYKTTLPFPEKGTKEDQDAWRDQMGIPKDYKEYKFEGEFGDDDKVFLETFQKYAHEKNIPQNHANELINFLIDQDEKEAEEDRKRDQELVQSASDKLHIEWGNNFRRNMNLINQFLDHGGEGLRDKLLKGRLADGSPFTSDPAVMKFLIDTSMKINPTATVVPGDGANISGQVDDELENIEKLIRSDSPKYWKDEKMQQRYRELIEFKKQNQK